MTENTVNEAGNQGGSVTISLPETIRDLLKLRAKHGADTPIGHRASNIIECFKYINNSPAILRQMDDLKRLLAHNAEHRRDDI
jgi:hypothetical protein